MRMRFSYAVAILVSAVCFVPSPTNAQDVHLDYCPWAPVICGAIASDHGWGSICDNTDNQGTAWPKVRCNDYSERTPRDYQTDCIEIVMEGSNQYECTATATVHCPYISVYPFSSGYITFQCTVDGLVETEAGSLGHTSEYGAGGILIDWHWKGVRCQNKSCGCRTGSGGGNMTTELFGNSHYSTGMLICD